MNRANSERQKAKGPCARTPWAAGRVFPLLPLVLALFGFAPPAGRPPTGPLERYEPRRYEVRFDVTVSAMRSGDPFNPSVIVLRNAPIVMPVIFQSTFSTVDPDSLSARLWYGSEEDTTLNARGRIDEGLPFHIHLAVIPVPSFTGPTLRWQVGYTSTVWSSRIDDAAAARLPWPREWPDEVQDGLRPQLFIESNAPVFAETVERVSEGKLHLVPPYLAAKDLVRYAIANVQVTGDGDDRRGLNLFHGLEVDGALSAANIGRGSPHDLVCVCVAMLRAAGIPARPVIGMQEDERERTELVSWAEFFLPGAGWIPFDPDELRGKGIQTRDVREPWSEFGTMKDLDRRVPMAFHFIPPTSVQSPVSPCLWGWDPRPGPSPNAEHVIALTMISRGRVQEGQDAQ